MIKTWTFWLRRCTQVPFLHISSKTKSGRRSMSREKRRARSSQNQIAAVKVKVAAKSHTSRLQAARYTYREAIFWPPQSSRAQVTVKPAAKARAAQTKHPGALVRAGPRCHSLN